MRRFLILFLAFVLFLNGCNDSDSITFKGKSDHWTANYVEKLSEAGTRDSSGKLLSSNYVSQRLSLKYEGLNVSSVGRVKYSYETQHGSGSGETVLNQDGYLIISGGHGGNYVSLTESDTVIVVTVEWNGMREVIRLTAR